MRRLKAITIGHRDGGGQHRDENQNLGTIF
jgi:hypothetical protein